MPIRDSAVRWLQAQTRSPKDALTRFTTGGFIFAGGLLMLLLVEAYTTDSLKQEGLALFALVVTAGGGLWAMWGYLSLSVFKVLLYLLEKHDHPNHS